MRPLLALGLAAATLALVPCVELLQRRLTQISAERHRDRDAERERAADAAARSLAASEFDVEVTVRFAAAPDPFALRPASLLVTQEDREIVRHEAPLAPGETVRVAAAPGLVRDGGALRVRAWPAAAASDGPPSTRVLDVRVTRGVEVVAAGTVESPTGQIVEGTVDIGE